MGVFWTRLHRIRITGAVILWICKIKSLINNKDSISDSNGRSTNENDANLFWERLGKLRSVCRAWKMRAKKYFNKL